MPDQFTETLANRIHELEARNAQLRARITKLEESRNAWQKRATSKRALVERLRSRVTAARRSRDLWKHRALRGPR